jgi:nucleoside-diphosphate-sugar epimerase
MRKAGIPRLIHVSSVAVIDVEAREPLNEASPLAHQPRERGPYVWGKLESERLVEKALDTHGIAARVVRLGPIVDWSDPSPPGKLGRQLGPLFLAVGSRGSTIATSGLDLTARFLAWSIDHFDDLPGVLHCLDSEPTSRGTLLQHLRTSRPGTRAIWLPWPILGLLSGMAWAVQKVVRRGKAPLNVYSAFKAPRYDGSLMRGLGDRWNSEQPAVRARR